MTQELTHEAQYKALCEKIEDLIIPQYFECIVLEDVLRTLGDNTFFISLGGGLVVFWKSEENYENYRNPTDGKRLFDWIIGKDLSSQSPETISFLHKILCL